MTTLRVKTQGIRGGNMKLSTKAYTEIILSNVGDYIACDNYTGSGKDYKQREDVLINIGSEGNVIFHGTFAELIEELKTAKVAQKVMSVLEM